MGKTEVRSRFFVRPDLTGHPKSILWAPSSLSLMQQNKHFRPHRGQQAVLMCSNALHCDFIAHMVLKYWNHECSDGKTSNSWWSWPRFGTENLSPCGPNLHLERHLWAHRRPCGSLPHITLIRIRIIHGVYTATYLTWCDGWRVGLKLVHAKCHCNHIRDNRYRDQLLVTLN